MDIKVFDAYLQSANGHGKPTYKGTRILVCQILDELEHGMSVAQIVKAWGRRVSKAAVLETIALAHGAFLDTNGRLSRALLSVIGSTRLPG